MSSFFNQLRPASWRGVPFAVLGGRGRFGRRNAQHEYPNRDTVWIEDLGRAGRRIGMTGFLVGDDVASQREAFIQALEAAGPGTLVHPTLGTLRNISLLEPGEISERWDEGRYFELELLFMEAGERVFPAISISTADAVTAGGASTLAAAVSEYVGAAQAALSSGAAVLHQLQATVGGWARRVQVLAQDATSLASMAVSLPGSLGRYFGASLTGFAGISASPTAGAATATVSSLVAQGVASQAAIDADVAALTAAAASGNPQAVATAVQDLVAALLAAVADPADGVRIFGELYAYTEMAVEGSSPIPMAMLSVQQSSLDLFRRAALQAMGTAASEYQPSSATDAAAVRNQVCGLIDQESDIAGDEGQDDVYLALRQLFAAVAQDLATRGAALPQIVAFSFGASLPAPVLAQRIYRDRTRADQLVTFANPVHPAFMPLSFQALAS